MGCDIHTVIERRVAKGTNGNPDKWVAVAIDPEGSRDRSYERFAALAGVRGEGPEPLGMPDDASDTAALLARDWGDDGHSHSWLPIAEAAAIYLATDSRDDPHGLRQKYPMWDYFEISAEDPEEWPDHRLVFWFDN